MKPKNFSPADIFFRLFPAMAGGFLGTGIFMIAFLLLQFPANESGENQTFPAFAVLVIAFLGAVSANLLATLFLAIANPEKFPERRKNLTHVFFLTIAMFFAVMPFILLSTGNALSVVGIYFIFSALISTIIIKRTDEENSITETAGTVFAGFFLLLLFMKIFESDSGEAIIAVLLFILPISWFFITLFALFGEMIGNFIKREE